MPQAWLQSINFLDNWFFFSSSFLFLLDNLFAYWKMLDDWKACRSHYLFPLLSCFTLMSSAAAAYYMNKKHTRISFLKNHKTTTHSEQIPSPPNKFPIIGKFIKDGRARVKWGEIIAERKREERYKWGDSRSKSNML